MPVDDPDWSRELQYRSQRNEMMKRSLQNGVAVQYRQTGKSMYPDVYSGDSCLFEPVYDCKLLEKRDIVFCQTVPEMHFYAHEIIGIFTEWELDAPAGSAHEPEFRPVMKFHIGNSTGHYNGMASDRTVYGRLVEVVI